MPVLADLLLYLVVLPALALVGCIALGLLSLALRQGLSPAARLRAAQEEARAAEDPTRTATARLRRQAA